MFGREQRQLGFGEWTYTFPETLHMNEKRDAAIKAYRCRIRIYAADKDKQKQFILSGN